MDRSIFLNKRAEAIIHSPFLVSDSYTITGVDRPLPQSRASDRINTDKTGITPNIERLANEWASGTEIPAEKAKKLVSKLRSELSYVLENPVPPENSHPIEYFLLQSRRGNCEYFAGALAMMLRSLNIPARVVEGFAGVESTEDPDRFLVRFARGHAWVEALLGDGYWTTLDPTPATSEFGTSVFWRLLVDLYDAVEFRWNKYVVHFDRADQMAMVQDVVRTVLGELSSASSINWRSRAPTAAVGIAAAILFALLIMLIRHRRRESDLSALYLRTMRDLTRKGLLTNVDTWHERNLSEIVRNYPESEQALLHFMTAYFRARFSTDEGIERKELRQARTELLDAIERSGNSAPARTS
jgi:hypothetical protein